MSHDCDDYAKTEAEAAALGEGAPRNLPKIPVRPCPTHEPRKFLTATTNYKVHFGTLNAKHDPMTFNVVPTTDLIVQVLMLERDDMDEAHRNQPRPTEDEQKRHERDWKRYENLIALVRLAGEPKIPSAGENANQNVTVAGVEVGHLNIQTRKAWTLE